MEGVRREDGVAVFAVYRFVSAVIVRKESFPDSDVATRRSLPSS